MVPLAYMLARAFGYVLNVNSLLVLLLILRQTLTKLRSFGLSIILPLDHHVELHKLVGRFIFFHAWVHSIAHFVNLPNFLNGNVKYFLCDNPGAVEFSCPKPGINIFHENWNFSGIDSKISKLFFNLRKFWRQITVGCYRFNKFLNLSQKQIWLTI